MGLEQMYVHKKEWCWNPTSHHTQRLTQTQWLNITAKTIKLIEENIRINLHDLGFDNGFLDMIPKA